jgi:hypothetical protein
MAVSMFPGMTVPLLLRALPTNQKVIANQSGACASPRKTTCIERDVTRLGWNPEIPILKQAHVSEGAVAAPVSSISKFCQTVRA